MSVWALIAAIGAVATWICGSASYSGGDDVLGDGVRALLAIAVFIVCGGIIVTWASSARDASEGRAREAFARRGYEVELETYKRQRAQYLVAEAEYNQYEHHRQAELTHALANRDQAYRTADELEAVARRCRLAADDLADDSVISGVQAVIRQMRDT